MNLNSAKRIVIKIGSALVTTADGKINSFWLKNLSDDIAELKSQGKDVIIVTSGAVALGRKYIGKPTGKLQIEEKQAASSCGQIELMIGYQQSFSQHKVSQVLLTISDTENRRSYLNAKSAMETILEHGVIPIINENDTVATSELRFGDNDRLSARVAQMIGADALILLTDIDGLYTADPKQDKNAKHITEVPEITTEIERMAGGAGSSLSTGGMVTKIMAAKIAVGAGCTCIIARGNIDHPLKSSGKCTKFLPRTTPLNARKQWILAGVNPAGIMIIDEGAEKALQTGKSLLPAGVREIKGSFERGDLVVLANLKGDEIGRGLSSYSSEDAVKIIGKKSDKIEEILGFVGREELIHRDDLVLTR